MISSPGCLELNNDVFLGTSAALEKITYIRKTGLPVTVRLSKGKECSVNCHVHVRACPFVLLSVPLGLRSVGPHFHFLYPPTDSLSNATRSHK